MPMEDYYQDGPGHNPYGHIAYEQRPYPHKRNEEGDQGIPWAYEYAEQITIDYSQNTRVSDISNNNTNKRNQGEFYNKFLTRPKARIFYDI